ncbi:MAG: sel1 repeat family protein [Chromatiales bacterium]|nr:sel1 repeat family protein [Chromatiales bacterium]
MLNCKLSTVTLSLLLFLLTPLLYADSSAKLAKGIAALDEKEWETAHMFLAPLAEAGNSEAQFRLGYLYRNGFGVDKNFSEAVSWYQKAAISGHAQAQHYFAVNLELGRGITQDLNEAAIWYRRAAEQGSLDAQFWMAKASLTGNGLKRDLETSYLWHILALEQDPECGRLQNGLDELTNQLTPLQIQALDDQIDIWRANGKHGVPKNLR